MVDETGVTTLALVETITALLTVVVVVVVILLELILFKTGITTGDVVELVLGLS